MAAVALVGALALGAGTSTAATVGSACSVTITLGPVGPVNVLPGTVEDRGHWGGYQCRLAPTVFGLLPLQPSPCESTFAPFPGLSIKTDCPN